MGRTPCCDKTKVKRGPWSPEEDSILKNYLNSHGTGGNWIALPHKAGLKRCGKSCRLRWLNYLRPDIKHGGFTEEEDNIILNLYLNIGSRWSVIASKLQGRTDNDVKNYWNTKMKKKLVEAQRGNYNFSGIHNSTISPKIEEFNDYENKEYPVMNNSTSTTSFPGSTEISSKSEVSGSSHFSIISWLMDEEVKEEGTSTTLTSSFNTASSSQENTPNLSPSFSLENNDYASWYGVDMGVAYDDQGELGFIDDFDFQEEIRDFGIEGNSNYTSLLANYSRNDVAQGLY